MKNQDIKQSSIIYLNNIINFIIIKLPRTKSHDLSAFIFSISVLVVLFLLFVRFMLERNFSVTRTHPSSKGICLTNACNIFSDEVDIKIKANIVDYKIGRAQYNVLLISIISFLQLLRNYNFSDWGPSFATTKQDGHGHHSTEFKCCIFSSVLISVPCIYIYNS